MTPDSTTRPPADAGDVLSATAVQRRFLLLRGLRWLPTGLLVPVLVLLLLERGLTLADIGVVTAAQGAMVLLLELPTGGLADALGRRRVLLAATAFDVAAVALLLVADRMPLLVVVFALQGIYRALESGPLDAWYVDAVQTADPDANIEGGLAAGGVVIGTAIGVGTLMSGGLVALGPMGTVDALAVPLLVALVLRLGEFVALWRLLIEVRPARGVAAVRQSVAEVPTVVRDAVVLIRHSRPLVCLVAVEFLWGLGMVAFETYTPPRLAEVLGDPDRAAALMGPVNTAAWLLAAAGAACVPVLVRWAGAHRSAVVLRVVQGATTVGIALLAGPLGIVVAFLATMAVHGAANPVHQALLHRAAPAARRATVISANSLTAQAGGALGGIALGALAGASTLPVAIVVGAAILAAPAPLYLLARAGRHAAE